MRKGGLLDNFPLFLLTDHEIGSLNIVFDSPDLGYLDLTPVYNPSGAIVVLISSNPFIVLEKPEILSLKQKGIYLVIADPQSLPFKDHSIHRIIYKNNNNRMPTQFTEENTRSLDVDGQIIEITQASESNNQIHSGDKSDVKTDTYYIRPHTGREYFVVTELVPAPWPFKDLQLGVFQTISITVNLFLSKLKKIPGINITSINVRSKSDKESILDVLYDFYPIRQGEGKVSIKNNQCHALFIKAGWNAILLDNNKSNNNKNPEIIKLPLSEISEIRLSKHATNITALHEKENKSLTKAIPKIVKTGKICGQPYWVETKCSGSPTKFWWSARKKRKALNASFAFILDLHKQTMQPRKIKSADFDNLTIKNIEIIIERVIKYDPSFCINQLNLHIRGSLIGVKLPLVRTHGDYWSGNILFDHNANLSGVIDWDASITAGWPVIDLLHLVTYQNKRKAYWHFGTVLFKKIYTKQLNAALTNILEKYFNDLSIDSKLWPGFIYLYWLERVSQWIQTNPNNTKEEEKWIVRNIIEAKPMLSKIVMSK